MTSAQGDRRSVTIPVLGAINETKLLAEGWVVIRDPHSGFALYEQYIGTEVHPFEPFACACPECGWDNGGELEVRDWYDDAYPPIPRPRNTLHVIGDPEHGRRGFCPQCDEPLEPETVTPRFKEAA